MVCWGAVLIPQVGGMRRGVVASHTEAVVAIIIMSLGRIIHSGTWITSLK